MTWKSRAAPVSSSTRRSSNRSRPIRSPRAVGEFIAGRSAFLAAGSAFFVRAAALRASSPAQSRPNQARLGLPSRRRRRLCVSRRLRTGWRGGLVAAIRGHAPSCVRHRGCEGASEVLFARSGAHPEHPSVAGRRHVCRNLPVQRDRVTNWGTEHAAWTSRPQENGQPDVAPAHLQTTLQQPHCPVESSYFQ